MPSIEEIVRSLRASWRMLAGDIGATRDLDQSVGGFWRSFAALLLVLPFEIVATTMAVNGEAEPNEGMLGDLPLLVLDFVTFPIVLALLARPLGIASGYVSYVVARNWVQPLSAAVLTVPVLLQAAGVPGGLAFLALIAALGFVLRLYFRLLREVLHASLATAAGLFVLDIVIVVVLVQLFG